MTFTLAKPAVAAAVLAAVIGAAAAPVLAAPFLKGTTATPGAPLKGPDVVRIKMVFGCAVSGTPIEFPNDIGIFNTNNFAIPAGVKVLYSTPFGGAGIATLPALAPGQAFHVSNAVPGGLPAGTPCTAKKL